MTSKPVQIISHSNTSTRWSYITLQWVCHDTIELVYTVGTDGNSQTIDEFDDSEDYEEVANSCNNMKTRKILCVGRLCTPADMLANCIPHYSIIMDRKRAVYIRNQSPLLATEQLVLLLTKWSVSVSSQCWVEPQGRLLADELTDEGPLTVWKEVRPHHSGDIIVWIGPRTRLPGDGTSSTGTLEAGSKEQYTWSIDRTDRIGSHHSINTLHLLLCIPYSVQEKHPAPPRQVKAVASWDKWLPPRSTPYTTTDQGRWSDIPSRYFLRAGDIWSSADLTIMVPSIRVDMSHLPFSVGIVYPSR